MNEFSKSFELPENQQNLVSVFILLGFLLFLPFIFDALARYYEGMKVSERVVRLWMYMVYAKVYMVR